LVDRTRAETSVAPVFRTAFAAAVLLALFCALEWLVLVVRLPVAWSPAVLGLILRNTLMYALTGLLGGAALGVCLTILRRIGGSRVNALTRPPAAWALAFAGIVAFYWVDAANVLYPGGSREPAALALDGAALVAGAVLACVLVRRADRGGGVRRALVAGAVVTVVLWLPFYALIAGRAGERIDGGPDLRRVDVERVVQSDIASPPNVLLIMLDTTRTDCLGCYGATDGVTPNIDRLASESLLFEQAVTPEPLTRPAVATMLTGLYPRSHGVDTNTRSLDAGFVTLAEALQERGYVTGAFMAASVLSGYYGTDQGFDSYTEPSEGRWELSGLLALKRFYVSIFAHSRWSVEIPAAEVTRRAATWIRNNGDRPFFAFVHYFDAHYPYEPPAEHDLASVSGLTGLPVPYEHPQDRFRQGFDMPDDFLEMTWLKYKGEIAYTDEYVGVLLDALDDMGLADDTLVILLSDHTATGSSIRSCTLSSCSAIPAGWSPVGRRPRFTWRTSTRPLSLSSGSRSRWRCRETISWGSVVARPTGPSGRSFFRPISRIQSPSRRVCPWVYGFRHGSTSTPPRWVSGSSTTSRQTPGSS